MDFNRSLSRRDAVRYLGLAAAGVVVGCTPLRVLTHDYPAQFKHDRDLVDRVLRAFVATVIPGADPRAPDLTRAYYDPAYPFAKYAEFFAADLCRRAHERFGSDAFDTMTPSGRARVIQDGLEADGTTKKLYGGAIFLAQISFFAGIYDDDGGCDLIQFPGRYRGDVVSYDDAASFLGQPLTTSGNYA